MPWSSSFVNSRRQAEPVTADGQPVVDERQEPGDLP
jgi:hypothetical protein